MAAPANYTMRVSAAQMVGEVQTLLAGHGARRGAVTYDANGVPCSLNFMLSTPHGLPAFSLPANLNGMERRLGGEDMAGRLESGSRAEWKRLAAALFTGGPKSTIEPNS
ncbi:hypothetical protein [Streptomyces sp. NPDC059970]|uniref:hypothetical protein n=1 Tax=Streptomyces sp. NPDC059970 TaxID=3347019 RepID=UPI00369DCCCB